MRVLGIDPGKATGWCVYDAAAARVIDAGTFAEADIPPTLIDSWRGLAVTAAGIEQPKGYGPTRPQVVDCAWVAGQLFADVRRAFGCTPLERITIRRALRDAVQNVINVRDDASVWAALVMLHGDGSGDKRTKGREGGAIGAVSSHERAALAVAWTVAQRAGWLARLPF